MLAGQQTLCYLSLAQLSPSLICLPILTDAQYSFLVSTFKLFQGITLPVFGSVKKYLHENWSESNFQDNRLVCVCVEALIPVLTQVSNLEQHTAS